MCEQVVSRFAGGVASSGVLFPLPPSDDEPVKVHTSPVWKRRRRESAHTTARQHRPVQSLTERVVQYVQEGQTLAERLERLADLLGLHLACLVVLDHARELGLSDFSELAELGSQREALIERRDQWLPDRRWQRCLAVFLDPSGVEASPKGPLPDLMEQARRVEWMLSNRDLELVGSHLMSFPLAARVRFESTLSALKAFVARTLSHSEHHRLVGQLFERNQIDVRQAAELLRVSVPDALVFLDEGGYRRQVTEIKPDREAVFKRLLEARNAGQRWWESPELIRRNAVATQRIESIDARDH